MRRADAAALALLALCAGCLLWRLGAVPALSLDEAWIGLFANRLRSQGLYTPHQMNHYTGPLFAALAAAFFDARGVSLESLRLPGALLNAAALAGMWLHLRRRLSPEAGAAYLLLAAASAYYLMKGRVAWEVYALHPALLLGVMAALARPDGAPWALAGLTWLGASNHFIFLSVPASLVVLFGARACWRGEKEAEPRLRAAAAALAAGAVLALLKNPLSEEAWNAHRLAWSAAFLGVPALAAAAVLRAPAKLLRRPFEFSPRGLVLLFVLASIAYAVWHLPPTVQILAGPVVFKRLFALALPLPLSGLLHAWGLALAALCAWSAVRAWHDDTLSFHERTVRLWPAAFAAVFVAFRHTSSLRYYSLPLLIWLPALAAALARLPQPDKRKAYACAAAAALLTQGLLWRELASPGDRAPSSSASAGAGKTRRTSRARRPSSRPSTARARARCCTPSAASRRSRCSSGRTRRAAPATRRSPSTPTSAPTARRRRTIAGRSSRSRTAGPRWEEAPRGPRRRPRARPRGGTARAPRAAVPIPRAGPRPERAGPRPAAGARPAPRRRRARGPGPARGVPWRPRRRAAPRRPCRAGLS
ncbi:MAG: hypothetical protein M0D55_05085 [Elusimicrobiota bacterium]|nr:MAG: hypothetical protein M0D55_05085 [Elusimicrobiota bacterium]